MVDHLGRRIYILNEVWLELQFLKDVITALEEKFERAFRARLEDERVRREEVERYVFLAEPLPRCATYETAVLEIESPDATNAT